METTGNARGPEGWNILRSVPLYLCSFLRPLSHLQTLRFFKLEGVDFGAVAFFLGQQPLSLQPYKTCMTVNVCVPWWLFLT